MNTQWQPIYSVERSGVPELTVSGLVCVVAGNDNELPRPLLALGDAKRRLWTRSLLKPWQLLSHLPELHSLFPALKPEHIAIMMASHNAEPNHLRLLEEIIEIGRVKEEWLKCPEAYPQHTPTRVRLKNEGAPTRRIYHNCSGKHLGYLLSIAATGGNVEDYLNFSASHYQFLQEIVGSLLGEKVDFPVTTDGCQMPNYALSPYEMASLYQGLAIGGVNNVRDKEMQERFASYSELRTVMRTFPRVIGGTDRLDSSIMSGGFALKGDPVVVAKEGADGLLAIGVGKCESYPNGLGVLIKVSSGFERQQMDLIAREILAQVGLCEHPSTQPAHPAGTRGDHLRINFHFSIEPGTPGKQSSQVFNNFGATIGATK